MLTPRVSLTCLLVIICLGLAHTSCRGPQALKGTRLICSNGQSCSGHVSEGTTVEYRCRPYFTRRSPDRNKKVCAKNGRWSGKVSPCVPDCGNANGETVSTIFNGNETNANQWPWHAGLYIVNGRTQPYCGATLINTNTLITAAHCIQDGSYRLKPSDVLVAFGKHLSELRPKEKYSQEAQVGNIVIHGDYDESTLNNDIALVFLKNDVELTRTVRPVCSGHLYPDKANHHFVEGVRGIVVGWGATEENRLADTLQMAELPFVPADKCSPYFESRYLRETNFCAGYHTDQSNVCGGDSGGGLVFRSKNVDDRWYLQGVTSATNKDMESKMCIPKVAIFTRIDKYLSWIKRNILEYDNNNNNDAHTPWTLPPPTEPLPTRSGAKCNDNDCCKQMQNHNPTTGAGYLQFESRCANGGLHCIQSTGCAICWCPNSSESNWTGDPVCRLPC